MLNRRKRIKPWLPILIIFCILVSAYVGAVLVSPYFSEFHPDIVENEIRQSKFIEYKVDKPVEKHVEPVVEVVEPPKPTTVTAKITHYCACSICNGKWSWTEDGVNYSKTATDLVIYDGLDGNYCAATFGKLGDIITINGVDYKIVDRMQSKSGYKIDIFVGAGHDKCMELGTYKAEVAL